METIMQSDVTTIVSVGTVVWSLHNDHKEASILILPAYAEQVFDRRNPAL